tara:strand:+ start:936 stop:1538 length:603 start_codon:yes stop_codon:yes gene_type:complete
MLDAHLRPLIDPPLNRAGIWLSKQGITPNGVTLTGFCFGLIACFLIMQEFYYSALFFLVLNRLSDGLDGGIARAKGASDFGGFLDICCDFIIYAGFVFSVALAQPENTFPALFLIFSFIGPITSFLAYAIIAEKQRLTTTRQGKKSFYYLGGLCEGTETFFMLVIICLIPAYFSLIAYTFGGLCWITTIGRVLQAWQDFR